MTKDLIFVFYGGTMNGLFGAGVTTALQELNLYPRINSVYGISAGAHNAAYFLAEDTRLGSSIYYENLVENKFIKKNKISFLIKLILNFFNKSIKTPNLVDIDYLLKIEQTSKKLNIEKISKSEINFFIRVFNAKTGSEEYLEGRSNLFKKLQAASAIIPFYSQSIEIENNLYADGGTLSKIIDSHLEDLINNNPNKQIFLVFNRPMEKFLSIKNVINNLLWTLSLGLYFRKTYVLKKLNLASEYRKLKAYSKKPNVRIIDCDIELPVFNTNKEKLLKLYNYGIEKTKIILGNYFKK